jgi:hypothetical protein
MRKDVIQLLAQDFHDAVLNGIIKDEVVDSDRMLLPILWTRPILALSSWGSRES